MNAFESRWGFHPVSRETSKKLRFLNLAADDALRRQKRWFKWMRKAPHNRFIQHRIYKDGKFAGFGEKVPLPEPVPSPVLTERVTKFFRGYHPHTGEYVGYTKPVEVPWLVTDVEFIRQAARQARTPLPRDQVKPLALSEERIDELYRRAKEWLG